jgi:hypothetical protein
MLKDTEKNVAVTTIKLLMILSATSLLRKIPNTKISGVETIHIPIPTKICPKR